ncbi:MAG: aspartate kinase [Elusimicrobiota bacterium]
MKFGGSSVATSEKMKWVAKKVIAERKAGHRVVVVVSAPGDTTDDLIAMAQEITPNPDAREMDMLLSTGEQMSIALLSMAIKAQRYSAISLTGHQVGIITDKAHTRARITSIVPTKLEAELKKEKIVIVAGFQGINSEDEITTLGRGGSDLSAVALAAVLKADLCEIYTDVTGVYTTDPRVVRDARRIERISYDEMLEMAGSGAQVMQARSIEVAKKYGVDIYVLSTYEQNKTGTLITKEVPRMEDVVVSAVAFDKNQVKVTLTDVPDQPGIAAVLFGALAKQGINVDMIIQSAARNGNNDISFTVTRVDLPKTLTITKKVKEKLSAGNVVYDDKIAKISIIGVGMRSHPGVAAKMFKSLADNKINIEMISTSEIKISCVIREEKIKKAATVLHRTFGLDKAS